jgi:predicted nucleic acid-binding protein
MAVVVDTDVISFLYKGDTRGALYKPHLDGQFMFISFMTLAELRRWSYGLNWGAAKKAHFDVYLRRYSVQHSTPELCRIWAQVTDEGRRKGKAIAVGDAWIAATALYLKIELVTHNRTDFQSVSGLHVISEQ